MRPAAGALAAFPLAAAALATGITAVTGFSQASSLPPEVGARFYGFFLDRYPLFVFAIVYGLARIMVMAAASPASLIRRFIGAVIGLSLLLALSLHPTFGGLVLRAGFATGGMTFLTFQPMSAAYALGSAASAFVLGSALLVSHVLIGSGIPRMPLSRRFGIGLYRAGSGFIALWFAIAVIGAAHLAGFGPWPRRALHAGEATIALFLIIAGFLPNAVLVWLALLTNRRQASCET